MKKGIFITLEGPDGSGKTTQALMLYEYLRNRGYKVIRTREPGGTKIGEKLREILLNPENRISPIAEIFLYESIRAQHIQELIKPSLNKGYIIICERFSDATFAYQGYGRKIDIKMIKKLDVLATGKVCPDLTILFDIPPSLGLKRAADSKKKETKGETDRMELENLQFHKRVRRGYLRLAQLYPTRIKITSGEQAKEDVHKKVIKYVEKIIKGKKYLPRDF